MVMTTDAPPAPERRVWGFWPTFGLGVAAMVISLIVQAVVVVIFTFVVVVPTLDTGTAAPDFVQIYNAVEEMLLGYTGLIAAISVFASSLVGGGFVILMIRARGRAGIAEYLGLRWPGVKTALIAVAATVVIIAFTALISVFLDRSTAEVDLDMYGTSVWPALLWLAVVLVGPAFEEMFFRGFLFEGFRQSPVGAAGAIALTSLAWAILHIQYDLIGIGEILVMGIIMGIVRLKTGSLWSTFIIHALNNFVALLLIALASG
jgi:membrane protease YdiL (CAAX protease family)